ncbi:MAG: methylmalonyl Co-A mutase-associated GTPase MeaB [Anaerolineae bacterium]|nr:methylmalonyl Co-A mutase-associated GTPase MeaB [Anaerolineae bacterium]
MSQPDRRSPDSEGLAEQALSGDRRSLARLLSLVEDGSPEGRIALAKLFPKAGQAHIIGFTGSTGAGKSSLVNCVAREVRRRGQTLAVVAVDPTSPFSGGALLGDRLRMRDLMEDPGVFIRSMASRGHPGGVAHATRDVLTVFDALGVPVILVETVGAGQVQVEVASISHTIVLVEAPGMGDEVQALKAGLMEIADIIAVNKADRPEAKMTLQAIRMARLQQAGGTGHHRGTAIDAPVMEEAPWSVPVIETSALEGTGIDALVDAIEAHRAYLQSGGEWQALRARHAHAELEDWLQRYLRELLSDTVDPSAFEAALKAVVERQQDPASAARALLARLVAELTA